MYGEWPSDKGLATMSMTSKLKQCTFQPPEFYQAHICNECVGLAITSITSKLKRCNFQPPEFCQAHIYMSHVMNVWVDHERVEQVCLYFGHTENVLMLRVHNYEMSIQTFQNYSINTVHICNT